MNEAELLHAVIRCAADYLGIEIVTAEDYEKLKPICMEFVSQIHKMRETKA